jgi:hypothetical protein
MRTSFTLLAACWLMSSALMCTAFLASNILVLPFLYSKQQHQGPSGSDIRNRRINIIMPPFYSAWVQFLEPRTQVEVVLVGVFHGTSSSAEDVQAAMTSSKVNVLVLELCASRFADLQQRQQEIQKRQRVEGEIEEIGTKKVSKSWAERYTRMILQTMQRRGVATGLAAALLSGFTSLQNGMSGFTPGLEFMVALQHCDTQSDESSSIIDGTDIILADQDVDETLRKLGDLPFSASEVFVWERQEDGQRQRRSLFSIRDECFLHAATLLRAVFGMTPNDTKIPQVHLPSALLRNKSAITDLFRLSLSTVLLISIVSQAIAVAMGTNDGNGISTYAGPSSTFSSTNAIDTLFVAWIGHLFASGLILAVGALASIPVVKVILTERDEILTRGIQEGAFRYYCIIKILGCFPCSLGFNRSLFLILRLFSPLIAITHSMRTSRDGWEGRCGARTAACKWGYHPNATRKTESSGILATHCDRRPCTG